MTDVVQAQTPAVGGATARRRRTRALAVLGAVVATALIWVVAEPLLGNDLVVVQPGQPAQDLGLAAVAVVTLGVALLGWAALAVLERLTRHGTLIWSVLAAVVLLLSFAPVAGVEATAGTKVTLAVMHLAVGAVLLPTFWLTAARRRP
ncbi:hypothetical protein Daura_21210 [Dactylosporangium aurantiacum]|uniref:Uncharacterized protein n=1 Tax=Dactylosporangium aurantiacum TaxID=35754 RepID=A0A9Q9ILR1_9ACTN|nr:DUF6069 family protein [Dactylosporangium aurantiacum]MDG6109144.1 DUF6069 family protein [Dactylosporangium aurantiacum]UWZ58472.1 hypothetical protein Daura_21210 [Dactylosporangium aurantiacum]